MFTILVLALLGLINWGISSVKPELTDMLAICMVIEIIVGVLWLLLTLTSRCKRCKKPFAYYEVSRDCIHTRDTTERVTRKWFDNSIKSWEYYTDYVPAEEKKYRILEKCRYCGHEKIRYETEKIVYGK